MKSVFLVKKGKCEYVPDVGGWIKTLIRDTETVTLLEIESDATFNIGEHVRIPDLKSTPKIEKIIRRVDGGSEYYLDYYIELDEDLEERERVLAKSRQRYEQAQQSEIVQITNRFKEAWNNRKKRK